MHSGDTIIALHNGHLQFSYGGDNSISGLVLQSTLPLTLNTWHDVSLQTYHGDVMMQVDGDRVQDRLQDHGKIEALMESVFIGGLGSSVSPSLPGYIGCMSELRIDNKHVSLASSLPETGVMVTETRDVVECQEVTADLMVADQAAPATNISQDTFQFDEDTSFRIMNRVTKRLMSEKRTDISFTIKTQDSDGDIIKVGEEGSDMFRVRLVNGHLAVRLTLDSQTAEKHSKVRVNTDQWRRVVIERRGAQVLVRVDSDKDIFSLRAGTSQKALRTKGEYVMGGHLTGSIRDLRIKDRAVRRDNIL